MADTISSLFSDGHILILSGPSGSGKSSLCKKLFATLRHYYFSISTTTRSIRDKEVHGRDYFFASKEEFQTDIQKDNFFEWANIYDDYYGTSKLPIKQALSENKLVILDIDVQGKEQVVSQIGHLCTSVFITTPSKNSLKDRLVGRQTDNMETIKKRMNHASKEIASIESYDYLLINDDLDQTFINLMSIVKTFSLKTSHPHIKTFIQNWG